MRRNWALCLVLLWALCLAKRLLPWLRVLGVGAGPAFALPRLPKPDFTDAPGFYLRALKAFKKACLSKKTLKKSSKKSFRIQMMHDIPNTQLFAMLAAETLKNDFSSRCLILVATEGVALATAEHLAKYNVEATVTKKWDVHPDLLKQVIVCTYRRAYRFRQQSFRLKILGFSRPLWPQQHSYLKQISRISAELEVEIAGAFSSDLDVDYRYPMEQACADGVAGRLEGLIMPVPFPKTSKLVNGDTVGDLLATLVEARHEWTPMVVFLNEVKMARYCAARLCMRGISAALDPEGTSSNVRSVDVLCCLHRWRNGLGLPDWFGAVRSVVWFSAHLQSTAAVPELVLKILSQREKDETTKEKGQETRLRAVQLTYGARLGHRSRVAALSVASVWKGIRVPPGGYRTPRLPRLEETSEAIKGCTLKLLTLNGETMPLTEENLAKLCKHYETSLNLSQSLNLPPKTRG